MKSIMVGIRLKADVYEALLAKAKGGSVAELIKEIVIKVVLTPTQVLTEVHAQKGVNSPEVLTPTVNSPSQKDVLTDEKGQRYKLIGGVRYAVK